MAIDTRLFDRNEIFGITRYSHYDSDNDTFTIETIQDMNAILEDNFRQRNETDKHTRWNDGIHKVATIPLAKLEELQQKHIFVPGKTNIYNDSGKAFRRFLNDSENAPLRTRVGRI